MAEGERAGVLLATIDSPQWGGVATMATSVLRHLEGAKGLRTTYIYGLGRRESGNATFLRLLRGGWKVAERPEMVRGMRGVGVGRRLPSLEVFHYLGNLPEWLRWVRRHEILSMVGGTNHPALAFAVSGRPFVCWVASTLDEDRVGRHESWAAWRRITDRVQRPALRLIEGYIFRRASRVIALSRYTADLIHGRYRIPWERIEVVPQPIDIDLFHPGPREEASPSVIMVGRFTDGRKNVALLLHAFARVRPVVPEARLLLVGEAPDANTIRIIRALRLEGFVDFPGTVAHQETPRFYHRARVFAFSSDQEGLGIAALEAMACGLPVVSTRCGGPEEYVREGATGFLVDRGDDRQLASRLELLLQDRMLCERLGRRARQEIEEKYSEKRIMEHFDRIYRRVWPDLVPG